MCVGLINSISSNGLVLLTCPTRMGISGIVLSVIVHRVKTTGVLNQIKLCGTTSMPVTIMHWTLSRPNLQHLRQRTRLGSSIATPSNSVNGGHTM